MATQNFGKASRDWKIITILGLLVVLVSLGSWIGYTYYKARENGLILQGIQNGRVVGQRDVISSIQTTGYFAFNVANEQGEQQQMVLVGQIATPQQLQQAQAKTPPKAQE